jgi:hypothetical protein
MRLLAGDTCLKPGSLKSELHHMIRRAIGQVVFGPIPLVPVCAASSGGRCNTGYSVDPTTLLPENRSVWLYSVKP